MTVPCRPCSIPWAISSKPGASGIRFPSRLLPGGELERDRGPLDRLAGRLAGLEAGPLLGALGVVALAPAEVGLAADKALQLVEPVEESFGARRAARDVDVHRHELVRALHDGVVREHARGGGAGPHRDHPLGLEHLVVDPADDRRHLERDPAGENDHVGLPGRGAEGLGSEPRDVVARGDHRHHLDRAAGEPEGEREERVRAPPVESVLERRREDPVLNVLLEILPLEVPPQQVAGAQLSRSQALPLYFQSRAPRRQTKTRATSNRKTNTRISTSTKTLFVACTRTPTGYRKTTSMSNRMKSIAIM